MYAVRRYLYFSWSEWEALPWWQQKAYTWALQEAQPWARQSEAIDPKNKRSGAAAADPLDATASPDALKRHGIQVETG